MANFWTDLNREIAAYEAAERADEIERDMMAGSSDFAVNDEDAVLIPAHLVADPDEPAWSWGVAGNPWAARFVAGQYGDPWGRDMR